MIKAYRPTTCNCTQYVESDVSATLHTKYHYGQGGDGALIVYKIDAMDSNAMKSKNPHSGIHEVEVINCLDTSCLNPSCNQGGIVIVESIRD